MSIHLDERTAAVTQKWGARGMWLLSIALAIDVMVRAMIVKQEPHQYLDISLIWIAAVLYVAIGAAASGVEPAARRSKIWLVLLVVLPLTNVAIDILTGRAESLAEVVVSLAASFAGVFLALLILQGVYRVWERRALGRAAQEE